MSAATESEVPPEFAQALRELGLAGAGVVTGTPLTGGVSSDIWRIDSPEGPVCVKRALAKLRVAADWRAPIERNRYEARWMRVANEAHAGCAPRVLGQHPGLGVLVMNYLPPSGYALWKQQLRDGHAEAATAREVGRASGGSTATGAAAGTRGRVRHGPDLPRHPPRALPARHRAARIRISRPRLERSRRRHRVAPRRAGARRRQPEEHPGRRRGARCSSTPSAPGTAIRPSTSPSA